MEDSCVVDQHIDPTEPLQRLLNGLPALVRDAHVGADEQCLTTIVIDGLCDLLAPLPVAAGERDSGTLLGEQDRGGATDARRSAGDQRNLAVQFHRDDPPAFKLPREMTNL
jgi:hypothetical protein